MAGIRRAEEAILKQTIDASFLDFVPKHKGRSRSFALSGVFAGTANPDENFLPPGKVASERFLVMEMDIPRFVEEYESKPVENWISENAPHLFALARKKIKEGVALDVSYIPGEISEKRTEAGESYRGCLNPELLDEAQGFIEEKRVLGADRDHGYTYKELRERMDPDGKIPSRTFSKVLKDNAGFTQEREPGTGRRLWFLPDA